MASKTKDSGGLIAELSDVSNPIRVSLNAVDRAAIRALSQCNFPPGGWVKRFARNLSNQLYADPAFTLTTEQFGLLWKSCWYYRRQIRDDAIQEEAALWHSAQQDIERCV